MNKKKEKAVFGQSKNKEIDEVLEKFQDDNIDATVLEEIKLKLNTVYKEKMNKFKDDYHKYAQSGRFVTSTYTRRIRKRDLVCFINLETDLLIVERVEWCDGVTVKSKSYEYPVSLIKTIEIKIMPLLNFKSKIIIHLAISNIYSLDMTNKLRNLADSVFMKSILRYQDKKMLEKPLTQIIIAGLVFGLVLYVALIQVFKKAILRFLGELQLRPPEE